MSLIDIEESLFNSRIMIVRRAITVNDIGDFTEQWETVVASGTPADTIVSGIKASIQPISVKEQKDTQGLEFIGNYKMYANESDFSIEPLNYDRVIDLDSDKYYTITAVQFQKSPLNTIGHHYKFIMKSQDY